MKNNNKRVVVAMSGGVDSSVAAALMVEQGYEVIGLTLQLYNQGKGQPQGRTCCAGQDIYDARQVADQLNIPHYVLDYEHRFKSEVIDDFVNSYVSGITPIPCVRCNERIKFRDLLKTSQELGAESLVTGHYVRRLKSKNRLELHTAVDADRDQSYFLFTTKYELLDFLVFPLGDFSKNETRLIANKYHLPVAAKPDSQDICFVPDGNYARTIEMLHPGAGEPGNIILENGKVIGRHSGVIRFTVGQRRGINVSWTEPLYVMRLHPAAREVVVGPKSALNKITTSVKNVNWLDPSSRVKDEMRLTVKVRSTSIGVPAKILVRDANIADIVFESSPGAIAPGQAAVFYDGTRLMGGGWIHQ
jgi:tRNA-specific 2-thiouridylase